MVIQKTFHPNRYDAIFNLGICYDNAYIIFLYFQEMSRSSKDFKVLEKFIIKTIIVHIITVKVIFILNSFILY